MDGEKKKGLALLIGMGPKGEDKPEGSEPEKDDEPNYDDAAKDFASDLMSAINDKDESRMASVIGNLIRICKD